MAEDNFNGAVYHTREAGQNFKGAIFHTQQIGGGGGGGDQHNLGWYATQAALEEAHPTATAGDWAIVGSTDTVWLWDTDNEEWVDSDQKGQVTSVNEKTGAVVLTAKDVDALPQYSTMPAAASSNVGEIAQYVGVTNSSFENGYIYKVLAQQEAGQINVTQSMQGQIEDFDVDVGTFEEVVQPAGATTMTFTCVSDGDIAEITVGDDPAELIADPDEDLDQEAILTWGIGLAENGIYTQDAYMYAVYDGSDWVMSWDAEGTDVFYNGLMSGVTITGQPVEGDFIGFNAYYPYIFEGDIQPEDCGIGFGQSPMPGNVLTVNYTPGSTTYYWSRIQVQPLPTPSEIGAASMSSTSFMIRQSDWNQTGTAYVRSAFFGSSGEYIVAPYDPSYMEEYSRCGVYLYSNRTSIPDGVFKCTNIPKKDIRVQVLRFDY